SELLDNPVVTESPADQGLTGGKGRERALPALAARGFRAALVPDPRSAGGTGPPPVERLHARQGGLHLARSRSPAPRVDLDVQGRLDVGLQLLEERLEIVEHGPGVLLEGPPESLEELADLPLLVGLAPAKREGRFQGLA